MLSSTMKYLHHDLGSTEKRALIHGITRVVCVLLCGKAVFDMSTGNHSRSQSDSLQRAQVVVHMSATSEF